MNIKISIKDCDCEPAVITKKQISEVQFKKKNMLYAPPTKDSKNLMKNTGKKQNIPMNTSNSKNEYSKNAYSEQAQMKFMKDISQISKNQATMDMVQNTHLILQKQNEILESNQKTIHQMLNKSEVNIKPNEQQASNKQLKRIFQQSADKIAKQVRQIKKMRDQIIEFGQNFKKAASEGKPSSIYKGSEQIGEMNSNLKNLVQISKNHIQGLQNLEGIKSLQNFNIEAYTQAVNTLKKQIVQYQKQSQTIERQLKLRAAKLQKLQISPNFQEELLQPYEQYLKKKADNVDLHSIRQKVYDKLGVFDYGKFQIDLSGITNQIKNQMNEFYIICKQFRMQIPDIKIDKKQLKQLDLKLPSILDEYKAAKRISFSQKISQQFPKFTQAKKAAQIMKETSKQKTNPAQKSIKKFSPRQTDYGQIYTKPVDYSKSTKLTRVNQKQQRTVLQTIQQKQKKQVIQNVKKANTGDDFQKYLENRAKQQLAAIYDQKKRKLQQMEKQLYQTCKQQPKFQLTLNVRNKASPQKVVSKQKVQQEEQQYDEDFEEKSQRLEKQNQNQQLKQQKQSIKNIGTEVLRQKLKNLFSKNPNLNSNAHQNRLIHENIGNQPQIQMNQMNNIAEGFISMINNTLTQVNNQLSQSIQKKMENRSFSQQKKVSFEKKSPNRITIPKLQQFRAPPVFNMQMVYQPAHRPEDKKSQKKILAKDYNYLRIQEQNNQLQISSISNDDF